MKSTVYLLADFMLLTVPLDRFPLIILHSTAFQKITAPDITELLLNDIKDNSYYMQCNQLKSSWVLTVGKVP